MTSTLAPLPALGSALHPVLPIKGGIWLLWPLLTSARSPQGLLQEALLGSCGRLLWLIHTFRCGPQSGSQTASDTSRMPVEQISPDKDVNCGDTTAAFTLSPESWALVCCADFPFEVTLYAISVRRLIALHSGFLWTPLTVPPPATRRDLRTCPSARISVNDINH